MGERERERDDEQERDDGRKQDYAGEGAKDKEGP